MCLSRLEGMLKHMSSKMEKDATAKQVSVKSGLSGDMLREEQPKHKPSLLKKILHKKKT